MKNKTAWILGSLMLLTTTQALAEDQMKKEAKVCSDIKAVDDALDNFEELESSSTIAEARAAEGRVTTAVKNLAKSAKSAYPEQFKALHEAHQEFDKSVMDAPKDATLAEHQSTIDMKREQLRDAYDALEEQVDCP